MTVTATLKRRDRFKYEPDRPSREEIYKERKKDIYGEGTPTQMLEQRDISRKFYEIL